MSDISIPPEVAEYLARPENFGCTYAPCHGLDENGRCCGRKPWQYKRENRLFCGRCHRSYRPDGAQVENWAYSKTIGGWIKFRYHSVFHQRPPEPVTVA